MRMEPHAIAELASRLTRGSVVVSATNGKTTTAGDDRLDPGAQRGSRSSTTGPARTWPGESPRRCWRRRGRGGEIDGELGLFEVDEFWLDRVSAELRPRAILLSNLFRDQLDRYGELETIADRWAQVVAGLPGGRSAGPQRRRPADRRPRP